MGKSIRSKIKRAHRAVFRAGEGARAAERQMAVVQENLKKNMKADNEVVIGHLGAVQALFNDLGGDEDLSEHDGVSDDKGKKKDFVQRKKMKLLPKQVSCVL